MTLTNKLLNIEKYRAKSVAINLQSIFKNWARSHNKLNRIIDAQIPDQCEKILGGNIDEACNAPFSEYYFYGFN